MMKTKILKCPRCRKEKGIAHPMYGVLIGKRCLARQRKKAQELKSPPEFPTITMRDRIVEQRDRYEKDILQPFVNGVDPNPEFVKAYPEQSKEYFTQEQLEKL